MLVSKHSAFVGLKQSVLTFFTTVSLADAKKHLWDASKSGIESAGVMHQASEGRSRRLLTTG